MPCPARKRESWVPSEATTLREGAGAGNERSCTSCAVHPSHVRAFSAPMAVLAGTSLGQAKVCAARWGTFVVIPVRVGACLEESRGVSLHGVVTGSPRESLRGEGLSSYPLPCPCTSSCPSSPTSVAFSSKSSSESRKVSLSLCSLQKAQENSFCLEHRLCLP